MLATDIDVSWSESAAGRGVEVRRHDVARDLPPAESFDLVHARLVLVHVAERADALRSMVQALRPGGWILVEDADPALQPLSSLDPRSSEDDSGQSGSAPDFGPCMGGRGADLAYGRKLPGLLQCGASAWTGVAADAYFPVAMPECAALETTTIEVIRDQLVRHGIATAADIESHLVERRSRPAGPGPAAHDLGLGTGPDPRTGFPALTPACLPPRSFDNTTQKQQ